MKAVNRVVFNTGILYIKLIITVIASLFTTRFVLDALGETNYGIYALVAGVVGMLGFLRASMSGAAMRFMGHSLGSEDIEKIRKTFNNVLFLHFIIGVLLIIVVEVTGLLLIEYVLEIPPERLFDAKIVFHFMVLTLFFTIIEVPYDAVINAHENLLVLSVVDIVGVILKLGIAIYLTYVSTNLLVLYGGLMFGVQFLMRFIKQYYSSKKYKECTIQFIRYIHLSEIKNIISFTSWNILGAISSMSIKQVRSVLLNIFFGVAVNSAEGIAKRAAQQINQVSVNLTRAIYPQILKSEGSGNRKKMLNITEMSTKFSLFLFSLFGIPILMETSFLLDIWLTTVPEYAVIFIQLNMVAMFIEKCSFEVTNAMNAVGNIKKYMIAETIIRLLNVPAAFLFFKLGYPPPFIFIVYIFMSTALFFERIYLGKIIADLNIRSFVLNGLTPIIIPVLISLTSVFVIHLLIEEGFLRLFLTFMTSIIVLTLIFLFFGLQKNEAIIIRNMVRQVHSKILYHKYK